MKKAGIVKKPKLGVIAKKVSTSKSNFIAIVLIIIAYLLLFFVFKDRILFTPDFGESDANHINTSLKFFLANQYKSNQLPFWTNLLQGGFPLIGESQIGAFFLPNYIFLKFFSFADGYNLLFIFSCFLLTWGFYLLLRSYKINSFLALVLSFTFTFNGAISFRFVHLNSLQTFSIAPLLLYCIKENLEKREIKYLLLIPFLTCQLILAGYIQVAFIVLLGIGLWFIFNYFYKSDKKLLNTKNFILPLIFGFILASPQIVETIVLIGQSSRKFGLDYEVVTSLPTNWPHLISYIFPYFFGDSRLGTYPMFNEHWGIFWENTPFIGLGLFSLVIIAIIYLLFKKEKIFNSFLILFFIFILLALGNNSPFFFLFGIFPFSLFRTPPKYFYMANFFLFVYMAVILQKIIEKNSKLVVIIFFTLIINFCYLVSVVYNYHLFTKTSTVLSTPDTLKYVNNNQYLVLGGMESWNEIYLKKGWSKNIDLENYLFQKNFLYPNSNLIWNKKAFQINTGGFSLRRNNYISELIFNHIEMKDGSILFGSYLVNLLKLYSIDTVISSRGLVCELCKNIYQVKSQDKKFIVYIYKLSQDAEVKDYYLPSKIYPISFLSDFNKYSDNEQISENAGLIESEENKNGLNSLRIKKINYLTHSDQFFEMSADFESQGLLVIKKIVYPNLKVMIDGKEITSYKVNLVHTGMYISAGKHVIRIEYSYGVFYKALVVAIFSLVVYLLLIFYKVG